MAFLVLALTPTALMTTQQHFTCMFVYKTKKSVGFCVASPLPRFLQNNIWQRRKYFFQPALHVSMGRDGPWSWLFSVIMTYGTAKN